MRLPQALRFGLSAMWALMTLLSVPTLADGVAGWGAWLGFVRSSVGSYAFPTLGVLGFVIFSSLQITEIRARKRTQPTVTGVFADIEHQDPLPVRSGPLGDVEADPTTGRDRGHGG
jgi:hypothetical protein